MATVKIFDFEFTTLAQDSGQQLTNILFVDDAPTDVDGLDVEATAVDGITITLKAVDDKQVSASNYHFRLTFDPDELAQPEKIALDASHSGSWGVLCVHETPDAAGAEEERAPGDVHLCFLYKGDTPLEVKTGNPLGLSLLKVGARSSGGTRPAIVSFGWNKKGTDIDKFVTVAVAGGPGGDHQLTERVRLSLLAPRVQAAPTLMAGFASSDIVLNDGDTENGLVLRIVNTGLVRIPLSHEGSANPSRFTLRFEATSDAGKLWALGTASQVGQILIPAKEEGKSWVTDPNWSGKATWMVAHTAGEATWTLTRKAPPNPDDEVFLEPGEVLEVPIGKIVTGHATGRTPLHIGYSGLPGFGDGELVAFIQKYPLIFAGQKVGAGTRAPSHKLTVETAPGHGIAHTVGDVTLSTWVGNIDPHAKGGLGTQTDHPLYFYTNRVTRMWVATNGNVGIGTESPSEKLTVVTSPDSDGITHTDTEGNVKLTTRVDARGAALGTRSEHDLRFFTSGSTKMTLTTEGKLGIGRTPDFPLEVRTDSDKLGIAHTREVTVSGAPQTVQLATMVDEQGGWLGTKSNHKLHFYTNDSAPRMTLTADGNVGIGTSSPSERLTVHTDHYSFGITHTNGDIELSTYVGYGRAGLETKNNYPLFFSTNSGPPQLLIATNGNVGIGTETPAAKLDVHGDLKINGQKPIKLETYHRDTSTGWQIRTTYKSTDWIAVVAGFASRGRNSTGELEGVKAWPVVINGYWEIVTELEDINDSYWDVRVLFILNELVEVIGSVT
ncbi:hypothetical protein WME91_54425 [Sorangium sp. So ce269]